MTTKDDGGHAFPRPTEPGYREIGGMSLRDWFAGQALNGIVGNADYLKIVVAEGRARGAKAIRKTTAEVAYRLADAMLAERAK